jgi:hypothetical protein
MAIGPSLGNNPVGQVSVLNALVPPEGPKSLAQSLNFTLTDTVVVDLTITTAQGLLSTVQAVYADNSANTSELEITTSGTQQKLDVPAGAQGWFSLVATNRPKISFKTPAGIIVPVLLLNVPVSQSFWFPNGQGMSSGFGPAFKTVAVGGTPVTLWAAGSVPSQGAVIMNPYNASESLYVDIVNAAQVSQTGGTNGTSVELQAGDAFTVPPGFQGNVTVNATTNAHAFVAYGVGAGAP